MFEVILGSPDGPNKQILVDTSRDVDVRSVRSVRATDSEIFLMRWGGREIPFEATKWKEGEPLSTGWPGHINRSISFIGVIKGMDRSPAPEYVFADEAEREQALLLAAEALVVYGGHYNGLYFEEGYHSSTFWMRGEARRFTLASFGYVPVEVRWPERQVNAS